jgi:hypothetical protein
MNKNIPLLVLLLMLGIECHGQDLLRPWKKWINTYGTLGTGGPPPYFMHSNCCKIDTQGVYINSHKYSTLMYSTDSMEVQWINYGYLREEASGKVFYIPSLADTVQRLCYNFGAQVGDTMDIYCIALGFSQQVVISGTDSVFFGGCMRKRIVSGDEWISGVGSIHGLIYNHSYVVGMFYWLNCYLEWDSVLYHNPISPSCFFEYTGIDDGPGQSAGIVKIIPNPVTGISQIVLNDDFSRGQNCRFQILDALGRCLADIPVSEAKTISAGDFPAGVYLYALRNTGGLVETGKIIIQ